MNLTKTKERPFKNKRVTEKVEEEEEEDGKIQRN